MLMGLKQSVSRKKLKPSLSYSKTECTEIVEFEATDDNEAKSESPAIAIRSLNKNDYPPELLKVILRVEELQTRIEAMSDSQLDLYFATLKDDLHNNWEKVYAIKVASDDVKYKKIEIIDRIKAMLKNLNERYLKTRIS